MSKYVFTFLKTLSIFTCSYYATISKLVAVLAVVMRTRTAPHFKVICISLCFIIYHARKLSETVEYLK